MTPKEMGRKGGKARMKTMTAEQRRSAASNAAKARWADAGQAMPFQKGHHVGRPKLPPRPIVFSPEHQCCLIPLGHDRYAMIDEADVSLVRDIRWYAKKDHNTFYCTASNYDPTTQRSIPVWLHKLLVPDVSKVDHIDGNGLNNRRSNLRPASHAQNMSNRWKKATSSSVFKGVSFTQNRWRARLNVEGKAIFLGYFDTEVEAAKAYDAAARQHFGTFAVTNF